MATNVYVNTAAKDPASAICLSAVNTGPDQMLTMVLGDKVPINLYLVNGSGAYDAASGAVGYTVKVGIGPSGANPTGGTYTLTYGGDTTSSLTYNASASAVSAALNLLASIIAAGGVSVTGTWPVLTVTFTTVGARTAITAAVDALTPTSSILISEFQVGDGSTRSKQGLRFVRTPAVYQDSWVAITDGWTASLDLNTFELADLLGTQSALFTDLEIEVTDPDGNRRTWGKPSIIIRNEAVNAAALVPVGGATYLTEAEGDIAYVQNRVDITGLTGGTSTDLDSIQTASDATAVGVVVAITVSSTLYFYKLNSGTTAESSPDVIRPDDYATTTNEKYWSLIPSAVGHWTASNATYSGSEYTKWTPSSGSTNVSAIVAPKGSGAFILDTPDGASTGGNNRGTYSVDTQLSRGAASNVASGAYSALLAGRNNTVSGGYSAILAGSDCTVAGSYSVACGSYATAAGDLAAAFGQARAATNYSHVSGLSTANAFGAVGFGSSYVSTVGDTQAMSYHAANSTTNTTPTELYLDGAAATQRLVIPSNSTWVFEALVIGKKTSSSEFTGWKFFGVITRPTNEASTAIVGSITKESVGSANLDFDIDADTTNGSLKLLATGIGGGTVRWSALVRTAEINSLS